MIKMRSRGILMLAASLAFWGAVSVAQAQSASADVTHLRVTGEVLLPNVTRLGMNLGEQTYYDSGQMLKNLIYRNPGFEAMTYRSILHCQAVGADVCIDRRSGLTWKAGFWDGAAFEVLDGPAAGRQGTVGSSGPQQGGFGVSLDGKGKPVSAGDWISVSKDFPGDPAAGWWPGLEAGAQLLPERTDLPPGSPGHQALRIQADGPRQSAQIKSYFDTEDGISFVRLRGRYRLSFKAKTLSGFKMMHLHVVRIVPGARALLDQDVLLKNTWAAYAQEFTASEGPQPPGPVEVRISIAGGALLLDDVSLEKIDGDPDNHTVYRDEVVATLKELRPGVLRMMSSHSGLGSTVDNLLAPREARVRSGYLGWLSTMEDIPVGIPEFLDLCQTVGAEPWIVAPMAMTRAEARKLAEYLAGGATTAGGAIRVAAGHPEPWTRSFRTIHIELGNETWNGIYLGESIDTASAYGRRANVVFSAFRAAAGADAPRFDLAVGAQVVTPGRNREILSAAPLATTLAIAPYLMHNITRWASLDDLYGPLMAQPEQMSRSGVVAASRASAEGRQLAVYEVNLHTTEGTAPAQVLDRFTPSAAAGIAVTDHMLRMMRDHGIRDQMLFCLAQYHFKRGDGTQVRLWGSVVDMGSGNRKRPQWLAESLANRAVRGDLVRTVVTGADPRHDELDGNDGVRLAGVHEVDAYAFQDGKWHGLIVFNLGLHQERRIALEARGLGPQTKPTLFRFKSSGPGASNETENQVTVEQEPMHGTEMTLAPCSMAVLEWTE